MKNLFKLFSIVMIIFITISACDLFNIDNENYITWKLIQEGGIKNEASTERLQITFSENVNLTINDIIVGYPIVDFILSGENNIWYINILSLAEEGTVRVFIGIDKLDTNNKNVTVYKFINENSIDFYIQSDGIRDIQTSTKINLVFNKDVIIDDSSITILNGTGSISNWDNLTGNGKNWSINITVIHQGTVIIKINADGISNENKTVNIYKNSFTNTEPNFITITGLKNITIEIEDEEEENSFAYVLLYSSLDEEPLIISNQIYINNLQTATFYLFNIEDNSQWLGTGNFFIYLTINYHNYYYISKNSIEFISNNTTINISEFDVFEYIEENITFKDFFLFFYEYNIPEEGLTLDEISKIIDKNNNITWEIFKSNNFNKLSIIDIYKDIEFTAPYEGNDTVYPYTIIYINFIPNENNDD